MVTAERVRDFLGNPLVQRRMKRLAERDEDGRTLMDEVLTAYSGQEKARARDLPYFLFLDRIPRILETEPDKLKSEFYSQPFYRRTLANIARSVSEYGLEPPQKFSSPILIVWNFTNQCNLACEHCYQNAHFALPDELTLHEKMGLIDEFVENDVSALALSGGEPLSHPDFWPVADYAHRNGLHLSVATNGTLITKEIAARLKETGLDYVEISVDSIRPEEHDAFRGRAGCWEKTVEGIRNCVEAGLYTGIATTFTRNNREEAGKLIEFAKDLKVNSFYAFNFIPTGRGKAIAEEDMTPPMREELLKTLYETLMKKEIFAFTTCPQYGRFCYQKAPEGMIATSHYGFMEGQQAKMMADYLGGCGAGRVYCAVQPNGKVTPCVFIPIEVGDLRRERLTDIWHNSEVFRRLRDRTKLGGHCGACKYRSMCGGCRARAYGYLQDYMGPDPGCVNNMAAWEELTKEKSHIKAAV